MSSIPESPFENSLVLDAIVYAAIGKRLYESIDTRGDSRLFLLDRGGYVVAGRDDDDHDQLISAHFGSDWATSSEDHGGVIITRIGPRTAVAIDQRISTIMAEHRRDQVWLPWQLWLILAAIAPFAAWVAFLLVSGR